jgi:non-ribosomal peptide synthetase component E (peptide arylation enzyme)
VAECAVVAMPDDRLGERACAFIVTNANAPLDLVGLTRFLGEQHMAKQYWPERLELVSELPRTPSGKVQKYKLRELAQETNNS